MRLAGQANPLPPVRGAGQNSASSDGGLPRFTQHQQCHNLHHGILLALVLLIESLDLPLELSAELL